MHTQKINDMQKHPGHVVLVSHVPIKHARWENARHVLVDHDSLKRHVTGCFCIPSG